MANSKAHDENSDAVALERLAEGLKSMPQWPRAVFVRHLFDEETYAEIATEFGISVATVERHFAAAMCHLHRAIYEEARS